MKYFFNKKFTGIEFEDGVNRVVEELKKEGFGIITTIDLNTTFKQKLNVEFRKYKILGACNPAFALKVLEIEPQIGLMLPCNVIVEEDQDGSISISVIDPVASVMAVENPNLKDITREIKEKLERVIISL